MNEKTNETEKPIFNSALAEQLQGVIKSGFSGIERGTGTLVDRRTHPGAMPIPANEMFGAPKPQTVKPCLRFVIAGDERQYWNYLRENDLAPDALIYLRDERQLRGIRNVELIKYGSYFENPIYERIRDLESSGFFATVTED